MATLSDITVSDVKAYYGISDTTKDSVITVMLPLVVSYIQEYCRHDFNQTTRTAEKPVIDDRTKDFYLKYRPVSSSATFTLTVNSVALTRNTDFFVDWDTGRVRKLSATRSGEEDIGFFGYWTTEPEAISVTYTGGETLTADVKQVFFEIVGIYAGLKVRTYVDNQGVEATSSINSVPQILLDVLDRHKWQRT
jgi:hypothetical protein